MTDLLTTDHADSGEVLRFHPSVWETARLDVGELTQNMAPFKDGMRPTLRLADAHPDEAVETGELPVWPTGAEVAVDLQEPPIPRPLPLPSPNPPPKPAVVRNRHRRARPRWSRLARRALMGWAGTALVELAAIAALVVLR